MSIEYTSIEAKLKVSSIHLTATAPDDKVKVVTIDRDDILELYHMNHRAFYDKYADVESVLWELFFSVAGINSRRNHLKLQDNERDDNLV